ncbi:MAG: hypothetical protein ABH874_08245, partial [Methanobacteriota archaeon]
MKIIMLFLAIAMLPAVSAVGADFYVTDVAPKQVMPGEATTLNITLKNLGSEYAAYLRAILDPDNKSPVRAVGPSKKYLTRADVAQASYEYFGLVHQATEITLQYPVYVDENASVGTYSVPLKLIWEDAVRKEQNQTVYVGITLYGTPSLSIAGVATLPSRIYADSEFNLSTKIENIGTYKARAVEARLAFPGEFAGERTAFIGTLEKDKTSTATYNMKVSKDAPSKAYD